MTKLTNNRPIFYFSVVFMLGILLCFGVWNNLLWLFVAIYSLLICATVVSFVLKQRQLVNVLALTIVALTLGSFCLSFNRTNIERNKVGYVYCTIDGFISDDSRNWDEYATLVLRDVTVTYDSTSVKLPSRVSMTVDYDLYPQLMKSVQTGTQLTCKGYIYDNNVFKDKLDVYAFRNDTLYSFQAETVSVVGRKMTVAEKIRSYVKQTFKQRMSDDGCSVALGMVIGDKSLMSAEDKQAFSISGIAHIFAVSGLHVGFVVSILSFFMFRLKLKKGITMALVFAPAVFYAYVCGFSPSVVRALTMTFVLLLVNALGYRTDILTSLAYAVLVILLFRPLYLFDAGFLLSVSAVYGIATLTSFLDRRIMRTNWKRWVKRLLQSVALSFGASVGTFAVIIHFYGYVSLFGLVCNVLFIPILTCCFVMLLFGLIPLPFISYILWLPDKIIQAVVCVCRKLSSLPYSAVQLNDVGVGAVLFAVALFFFAEFLNVSKKTRRIVTVSALSLAVCVSVLSMLPKQNVNKITFCDCFDLAVIATNSDNDCVAVSQLTSVSSVQPILDQYKNFKKKDFAVFAVDLSKADLSAVKYLYENTSLTKIYTFDNYPLPSVERYLASKGVTVVKYLNTYGNSVVLSINKSVGESAYRIRTDTVSALFDLEYEARYGNLSSNEREVDVVFSKYNAEKAVSFFPSSAVVSYLCPENDNVFSIRQEGTFTLK